ncbi:MAG: hypothetical protein IH830_10615 [Planctomycetes bacterium]|nr:hypothetical protein [Planctomycetota bacterium]
MMDTTGGNDQAFFTVIAWPQGLSRDALADLLAPGLGMDRPTVYLRLGRDPPAILGRIDGAKAQTGIDTLRQRGGDAFAPTLADIEALGPTLKIKQMQAAEGRFDIVQWRGPPGHIPFSQIQILVRVQLSETKREPQALFDVRHVGRFLGNPALATGYAYGGAYGAALAFQWGYATASEDRALATLQTSHKLDLHTTDGKVYQIDGDKFGFQILGDTRGYSDNTNIDRMCELITHVVPDVIIDPYFGLWKPPPGHLNLRLPRMRVNHDDPAFAFYSRWAALLYRHVLGDAGGS